MIHRALLMKKQTLWFHLFSNNGAKTLKYWTWYTSENYFFSSLCETSSSYFLFRVLCAGAHAGGPEPGGLLQHVHGPGEEAGAAPPGVGQEEPPRHGLLRPDRVPEEDPVPVWAHLQVALHQAFHAVQQHPRCRGRPGQRYGACFPRSVEPFSFSSADCRQMRSSTSDKKRN